MKKIISTILVFSLINISCSTLNTKDSYKSSLSFLIMGDIDNAIRSLPAGEGNGFITIMERTYLNLLKGNPEIDELSKYSYSIDNQVRYKVTREAKSFFFVETPEGYYASEHEIIWMHFLLSWGYSLRGESSKARVEVNKASILLSNRFSDNGRFDDAFMRVFCGFLWSMCGEWDDARVDFRRALALNPSMKWIRDLIRLDTPPKNITLILGGIGYQPYWNPKGDRFIRGFRDVDFQPKGNRSKLSLSLQHNIKLNLFMSPDASGWYSRHKIRNSEIADTIDDVKYTEKFGASSAKMTTHVLYAILGGLIIITLATGLGGALLLLGHSAETASIGLAIIFVGDYKGVKFGINEYRDAIHDYKEEMNPSEKYRFVRFLPEYSWIGWSNKNLTDPLTVYSGGNPHIISNPTVISNGGITTRIGYFPDADLKIK